MLQSEVLAGAPLTGAAAKHVYVATGFGGWGMSTGVMAGTLLAGLFGGTEPPWARLYDPAAFTRCVRPYRS